MEKETRKLNPEEMKQASGGGGTINLVTDESCPHCGNPNPEFLGTDASGRFSHYRCPCGYEYSIYGNH